LDNTKKNCWTCLYQKLGGYTLLGKCLYFETIGKEAKEIPATLVDVGCKFWIHKDSKPHPLFQYAMELFDGEEIK